MGDGTWLTVSEAADRLRVSVETVRRWIESGALTAGRTPGGHRRVSAASVQRLHAEIYPAEPGDDPPPPAG